MKGRPQRRIGFCPVSSFLAAVASFLASVASLAFIAVLVFAIVMLVRRIPGGFVPEEDQGFLLVNALLPDAASLERTDAVMRKAEAVLKRNEAVDGYNTITGFSLLTGAYSSNMGFFFVQLKPWHDRHTEESHASGVIASLAHTVKVFPPHSFDSFPFSPSKSARSE